MDAQTVTADAHALGGAGGSAAAPTFLEQLIEAGLLIPSGVLGLYGRSETFEAIAESLNRMVKRLGADHQAETLRFPPAIGQHDFETSEYLKSFPQLAGTIHSFCGDDRGHRRLLARLEDKEDWTDQQQPTGVVLTPAACYPVYPVIARRGPLPPAAARGQDHQRDVVLLPARALAGAHAHAAVPPARVRVHRIARADHRVPGDVDGARAGRRAGAGPADGAGRGQRPFFGRGGKIVADSQRELKLKFELLIPVNDGLGPTACMSFNYHMDHFGALWGIRTADGGTAHTGCVGFGIERLTLALLKHHGLDPACWPQSVRDTLGGQ